MKSFDSQSNPELTPDQLAVLFDKATEPPFTGALLNNKDAGDYTCANCGAMLFRSDNKYDSGSGWPSFDTAVVDAIKTSTDNSHGMSRVEISCANCGGHLGHLFDDGPKETTSQRFCVNSLSLQFTPKD